MTFQVKLRAKPNCSFMVEDHETILEAALRQNIEIPFSCESGICITCKGKVCSGQTSYRNNEVFGIDPDNAAREVLFCSAYAESDLVIDHPALSDLPQANYYHYKVTANTALTPHLTQIRLTPAQAKSLPFIAGQYVELIIGNQRYPLSLASAPTDDHLELHIQTEARNVSAPLILTHCTVGQTVTFYGALGEAYLRPPTTPILLVAGGSGYAPIRSILKTLLQTNSSHPIHLYWGVRSAAFLYAEAEIQTWIKAHPQLHYTPVISEETSMWPGRTGLVHRAVCTDFPDLSAWTAYLAGPFPMSLAAREAFHAQGLPLERMFSDAYNL